MVLMSNSRTLMFGHRANSPDHSDMPSKRRQGREKSLSQSFITLDIGYVNKMCTFNPFYDLGQNLNPFGSMGYGVWSID